MSFSLKTVFLFMTSGTFVLGSKQFLEMGTYIKCLGPGNECPINANILLSFSQEKCPKPRLATKMLISGMCPCVRINNINFVVKLGKKEKECSGCSFCTLGPLPSPNLPCWLIAVHLGISNKHFNIEILFPGAVIE